jgi:hypothetical protein
MLSLPTGANMPDEPTSVSQDPQQIRAKLHDLARSLRDTENLEPATKQALADLADELAAKSDFTKNSPGEVAHLLSASAHVMDLLNRTPEVTIPLSTRERLEQAILAAETRAPVLAGLAHRLLDVLSDLGI